MSSEYKAVKLKTISLINGRAFTNMLLDPFIECPPGFIAVRASTITEGEPVIVSYIRVSSIASMDIEEGETASFWRQFNPLPETIATKTI